MKPLPYRRRALAIIAVGFAFLALGLSGGQRHTDTAVGILFVIVGIVTFRRGRQS